VEDQRRLIEQHRQDLFHLTNRVRQDLSGFLYQIRDLPVADVRMLLSQVIPDLVGPYMTAAGELSASWYEDLRAVVAARGSFHAQASTRWVGEAQATAISRWAVAPLADADDVAGTLARLAGAAQRMLFDAARGVVEGNVARDPVVVGYQRMPRPGCCAFCGMLAARGAVYRSSESAGGVVGRGSTRTGYDDAGTRLTGGIGGGVKARGVMNLGDRFHDDCYCVVMPVYFGTEMAELASAETAQYEAMYAAAASAAEGTSTKAILAGWRVAHRTH